MGGAGMWAFYILYSAIALPGFLHMHKREQRALALPVH
jgi:hypothetical protein